MLLIYIYEITYQAIHVYIYPPSPIPCPPRPRSRPQAPRRRRWPLAVRAPPSCGRSNCASGPADGPTAERRNAHWGIGRIYFIGNTPIHKFIILRFFYVSFVVRLFHVSLIGLSVGVQCVCIFSVSEHVSNQIKSIRRVGVRSKYAK